MVCPPAYVDRGMDACLVLTYGCGFRCRHCMYSCAPGRAGRMEVSQACRAIDQLNLSPRFDGHISLAGGEPWLVYDDMREIMSYGHERYGNAFTVSTNAAWATTAAAAESALRPLVSRGLIALQISFDDFHLQFGTAESVGHAVTAAKALGCEVTIQTVYSNRTRRKGNLSRLLPPDAARLVDSWTESSVIPAGRAASRIGHDELPAEWRGAKGMCTLFLTWTVMPDGGLSPCCSADLSEIVPFGNIFTEEFEAILARHDLDPILNAIGAFGGPYLLLKTMRTLGLAGGRGRTWSNHCHACLDILRQREAMAACREYLRGCEADLLLLRLHNSEQMLRYLHGRLTREELSFPEFDVETRQFR